MFFLHLLVHLPVILFNSLVYTSINKNYCITISIHKISSTHKFVLKIKQILKSRALKTMAILTMLTQRSLNHLFHLHLLKVQSILKFRNQNDHTNFWSCPLKKVLISFYFFVILYQYAKNSLFYLFTLQIQSIIIEYSQHTGYIHFGPCPPERFSMTFQFAWICTSIQKIS